jgi:hypothetical protein
MSINFKVNINTLQAFCNDSAFLEEVPLHIYEDAVVARDLLALGVDDIESVTVDAEMFEWIIEWKNHVQSMTVW